MGTESLVEALKRMFTTARQRGIPVDLAALVPAYGGMVKNSFILGISVPPSTAGENPDRIDLFIDLLHELVPSDERRKIDRIRVYNSKTELQESARYGFGEAYYDVAERPVPLRSEFVEMTPA